MGREHGNFIGGRWCPAGEGEGFVVGDGAGGELGRRPRASAGELEEAMGCLEEVGRGWWERGLAERGEVLRAMELGGELGACAAGVGARMGIGEGRALELLEEDLEELEAAEVVAVDEPGIALVRCAPSALLSGLAPLVMGSLERGWSVLLLADPALPWLAETIAVAWERAGGDVGALAVLHDDGATTARAVLGAAGRLAGVVVRDHEERLAELEAAMKVMAPRGSAAFGAGVLEVSGREVVFEGIAVRDATSVVTSECDPGEEAEAIHEAAFGSAEALGGERDGCVGRVVCHEGLFWAFTEALLACYDAQEEGSVMVREPLQRGHRAWIAELSQVAVGEGATWLRGGPSDSIGRGGRAKMVRSVFTNVEPNWRLARAGRPSPALALIRAPDDPGAHELALACDAGHAHGPE